jgi:hypothetical protein
MSSKPSRSRRFLPSKDHDASLAFYEDLGFSVRSSGPDLAYVHAGPSSFLSEDRPWGMRDFTISDQ